MGSDKIVLPEEYLNRMKKALGDEFGAFSDIYDGEPQRALRFNRKKARGETVDRLVSEWGLEPVPWCESGYYYSTETGIRPGLSPYHDAGVYYIQEPSAMITAEKADIGSDDIVLDLCAAPGGKSSQAAEKCRFLVSNEPVLSRARTLSSNIERMGFDNVVVCSAFPKELKSAFGEYFTRIIVDAPCSGEGMMRKDEAAVREWSPENVRLCILRQEEILDCAASMLKPGGRLVYSTCTFEQGENSAQIEHFLSEHSDFVLAESDTLYPHRIRGEGHFYAVLEKNGEISASRSKKKEPGSAEDIKKLLLRKKIHVLRTSVEQGETIRDRRGEVRYEPSHAEALAGVFGNDENYIDLCSLSDAVSYLSGNVLDITRMDKDSFTLKSGGGWLVVKYDGYAMGLGKLSGSLIKNHYPKGLRHISS